MSWEKYFPWNPDKLTYEMKSEPKVINENYHILYCNFEKYSDSPIIQSNNFEMLVLIDHCNFVECVSQNGEGIVYLEICNSGSVAVSNTYATKCDAKRSHFLRIATEEKSTIISRSNQVSASLCGLKITSGSSVINHQCDHPDYIGSNVSNSNSIYSLFYLNHISNGICSWINLVMNKVNDIIIYVNYRGILKFSNIVSNTQKSGNGIYYGLFCSRDNNSHFAVDQCYVFGNECESLCTTDSGEVYFFQCYIDKVVSIHNAVVASTVYLNSFVYTQYECTCLGSKYHRITCLHMFLIGYWLINLIF